MLVLVWSVSFASAANPPQPSYDVANVDGNSFEWDLSEDYFADMHEAGRISKIVLSKLYLRYDCENEVLYALVSVEDGHSLNFTGQGDHYIKINGAKMVDEFYGDNNVAPDFAFLGSNDANADGWEASTPLPKNQSYMINVHTQVNTNGGPSGRTSATTPDDKAKNREIPLITDCEETAITLAAFDADRVDNKTAKISWTTGTEINNFGFNIYRSTSLDGERVLLNTDYLISAEGDTVFGASYEFTDQPGYGTFYYWLEDVSNDDTTELHAPTMVKFDPAVRAPSFRPTLPAFTKHIPE